MSINFYPCQPVVIGCLGTFKLRSPNNSYSWGVCTYNNEKSRLIVSTDYHTTFVNTFPKPEADKVLAPINYFDLTEGRSSEIAALGQNGIRLRGMAASGDSIIMHVTPFYMVNGKDTPGIGEHTPSGFKGWASSSIHQLQTLGPMCRIPFHNTIACFNQDQQGGNKTNWGPALYTYDLPSSPTAGTFIHTTPHITYIGKDNAYSGWWPDRKLTSIVVTPKYVIYGYSHSVGQRWYGNFSKGKQGFGNTWNDPPNTPHHDIPSILNPGTFATDGTAQEGFHAEHFESHLLIIPDDQIIADKPTYYDIDLSPFISGGEIRICYNETDDLIYAIERNGDSNRYPLGHILKIS